MDIKQNVPLSKYSTMRLGGNAAYLLEVSNRNDLSAAVKWAKTNNLPTIMIGSGSNIVWKDEGFPGLVLVNKFMGYQPFAEDSENYYLTIGGGENWDNAVAQSVKAGATGIEGLSLIPGTAGATPVQNVGAYGQDISQTLVSLEAYDTTTDLFVTIPNSDCGFTYRSSKFKTTDRGRFFITGITLHLMIGNPMPPFYPALANYLSERKITTHTPQVIRDAVIEIRKAKLPDPQEVANNGSFFANPIIDQGTLSQILADFPDAVYWPMEGGKTKLSAAWLVEKAGFNKGAYDPETGMGTWRNHSLVLVNEHARKTADLLKFKQKIVDGVANLTGITLVQEPELLP